MKISTTRGAGVAALLLTGCLVLGACAGGEVPAPSLTGAPAAEPTAAQPAAAAESEVAASAPTHLSFPAAAIDGDIAEYTAAQAEADGGINPPGLQAIAWYSGVPNPEPASAALNTVYIFGHTWVEPAAFNGLKDVVPGDQAVLTTETGTLVYEVDELITMDKADFSQDPRVAAVVPGRLALVTCHRPDGLDPSAHAPDNTVVFLHLIGYQAAG
jgi:hypothetical protein